MGEKAVSIISSIAIINLLAVAIVCWIKSVRERFYLWLGLLIFAAAFAMINNLHVYLGYANIWVNHFSTFVNVSFGAYIILFIRNHRYKPRESVTRNLKLFIPSILYIAYIALTLLSPKIWDEALQALNQGKMTIYTAFFNLIIVLYSIGANAWLLYKELKTKKIELEISSRKQRIEILSVMLALQLCAFVPFVLKLDLTYVIVYMPVFGQLYFLYLFLRMWKLDKANEIITGKRSKKSPHDALKYATIKISDDKIQLIEDQLTEFIVTNKPYLIPEYSLVELSRELGIALNILSMVINSKMQTNFPDLINKYRIEKAKELLPGMKLKNTTIESIAYDCGFGNRTTFYAAFRKFTSQSPSEYLQEMEKGNLSVG